LDADASQLMSPFPASVIAESLLGHVGGNCKADPMGKLMIAVLMPMISPRRLKSNARVTGLIDVRLKVKSAREIDIFQPTR
jgi:hypothetical protein